MSIYYNEFEPYAVDWLKNLIRAGLIPDGEVDSRNILEVRGDDLKGFKQCHFFAGIGGWAEAVRLAGVGDLPLWTGSCPCQPFSTAGRRRGKADERHLWPVWFNLIKECRPPIVFGEQVAAAITDAWLDEVADDLEGEGYAFGSAVLPACSVTGKTGRERVWFVGDAEYDGCNGVEVGGGLEEAVHHNQERKDEAFEFTGAGAPGMLAAGVVQKEQWLLLPDGAKREIEPSICLLAYGLPTRVGKIRAYGNAIVPQVAAEFIKATRRDAA